MSRLWWWFRDLWCKPFGHVLYFPVHLYARQFGWRCVCSINTIGPPIWLNRWQFDTWRRMRRPT